MMGAALEDDVGWVCESHVTPWYQGLPARDLPRSMLMQLSCNARLYSRRKDPMMPDRSQTTMAGSSMTAHGSHIE